MSIYYFLIKYFDHSFDGCSLGKTQKSGTADPVEFKQVSQECLKCLKKKIY